MSINKNQKINIMKKSFFIILLSTISMMSYGQQYTDIVKIQPMSMIGNSLTFEWEHIEPNVGRKGKKALLVSVGIPVNKAPIKDWFNAPDTKLHTYNVGVEYRYYYDNNLYYGIRAKCQTIDWSSNLRFGKTDAYIFTTNLVFKLGKEWIIKDRWVIDVCPFGFELGMVNSRINTLSINESDAETMFNYAKGLSKKLPRNAIVSMSRNGREVEGSTNVFLDLRFHSSVTFGFKF